MPRIPRNFHADQCYHVINRGNGGATVFRQRDDYLAFVDIIARSSGRIPMRLLAACLMPNHFHFVVQPYQTEDLSHWMHWLMTTHVSRHRLRYNTVGHIWQGRFKPFRIQHDAHLLSVMRYVERNALRAGLVQRAEHWRWGSLEWRRLARPKIAVAESPVPLPEDWLEWVNQPQTEAELDALRKCLNRQRAFGDARWVEQLKN